LDWLRGQAEFPSPVPVPLGARIAEMLHALLQARVLVPALSTAAVVAVAVYMTGPGGGGTGAFPYGTWKGNADAVASLECTDRPANGLGFTGPSVTAVAADRLASFQAGWSAALIRDLVATGRAKDADVVRGAYSVRWPSRTGSVLPPNESLVAGRDPCVFGAVPDPGLCRAGVEAYGWVRDGSVPVPGSASLEAFRNLGREIDADVSGDLSVQRVRDIARALACR
jgi:hypothetical protein